MTVAAWSLPRPAKDAEWSWLKQMTSHRPAPGRLASRPGGPVRLSSDRSSSDRASLDRAASERDGGAVASVGNRFSKTTTSYSGAGISVRLPGDDGHRGQASAAGWKVRSCRWLAMTTHSLSRLSQRASDCTPVAGSCRRSGKSSGCAGIAPKYVSALPSASMTVAFGTLGTAFGTLDTAFGTLDTVFGTLDTLILQRGLAGSRTNSGGDLADVRRQCPHRLVD